MVIQVRVCSNQSFGHFAKEVLGDIDPVKCGRITQLSASVIGFDRFHDDLLLADAETMSNTLGKVGEDLRYGISSVENEFIAQGSVECKLDEHGIWWGFNLAGGWVDGIWERHWGFTGGGGLA